MSVTGPSWPSCSDSIVACDVKVYICKQLNELLKILKVSLFTDLYPGGDGALLVSSPLNYWAD